jgi:hypothetical protein
MEYLVYTACAVWAIWSILLDVVVSLHRLYKYRTCCLNSIFSSSDNHPIRTVIKKVSEWEIYSSRTRVAALRSSQTLIPSKKKSAVLSNIFLPPLATTRKNYNFGQQASGPSFSMFVTAAAASPLNVIALKLFFCNCNRYSIVLIGVYD